MINLDHPPYVSAKIQVDPARELVLSTKGELKSEGAFDPTVKICSCPQRSVGTGQVQASFINATKDKVLTSLGKVNAQPREAPALD